jgi:invasion protein IalB
MAAYRIAVTNPKTGRYFGFVMFSDTPEETLNKVMQAIQSAEDNTPTGELPATKEDWDVECLEM